MRRLVLLALLVALAGCESTQRIDRAALDERYQQTQLAKGVLSIVPLRVEPNQPPPVVVNWWYAGSSDGQRDQPQLPGPFRPRQGVAGEPEDRRRQRHRRADRVVRRP